MRPEKELGPRLVTEGTSSATADDDTHIVPLTADELGQLDQLEGIVQRGLVTFLEVGTALAEIRDSKLYRQTHLNFAQYLEDRFGISRSRGYQLIDAAAIVTELSTIVDSDLLPTNESQARELVGLTSAAGAEVMETVKSRGEKVTAGAIKAAKCTLVGAEDEPHRSESPGDLDQGDDDGLDFIDELMEIQREYRRLYQLRCLDLDTDPIEEFAAKRIRALAGQMKAMRIALGDPYESMTDELLQQYPNQVRENVELTIDAAFNGLRKMVRDPEIIRRRAIARYESIAQSRREAS